MDIQMITSIWACIVYITSYICKPEKSMSELMKNASKEANSKDIRGQLFHVADKMRRGREVSHHEAIMRLLSIPFRRSNVSTIFVSTDTKDDRTRILKPKHILDALPMFQAFMTNTLQDQIALNEFHWQNLPPATVCQEQRHIPRTTSLKRMTLQLPRFLC